MVVFFGYSSDQTKLQADTAASNSATFYVAWYGVGKRALEGLKGIKKVRMGVEQSREINTVIYDPSLIGIEEMETVLKKAGTYKGTAKKE